MTFLTTAKEWLAHLLPNRSRADAGLREFVYLDDVSVHSLLASRKGGIATEFTTNQQSSVSQSLGSSAGIGLGPTAAKVESQSAALESESSQVLSKAVIQTSFKELYEIERAALTLWPLGDALPPACNSREGLLRILESKRKDGWILGPEDLARGRLIEVEIELEADPIFHMATVVSTFRDFFEGNEELVGSAWLTQGPQMESLVRVLDALLAGLVPIRGRLVDYIGVSVGNRELLVHRRLFEQLTATPERTNPVYVVGVAERGLFWKDIRRVLFSGSKYTTLCRLAANGVTDRWHPVKVSNVLAGIVPNVDDLIAELSETARRVTVGSRVLRPTGVDSESEGGVAVRTYAKLLAEHHGGTLTPDLEEELLASVAAGSDWFKTVDRRRPVFKAATRVVEDALAVEHRAKPDVCCSLRSAALAKAGFVNAFPPQHHRAPALLPNGGQENPDGEKYLEGEIVGIYW